MCGIPLSVHSLVTGLAVSLHGNSRLATCTRLNSRSSLLLKHLVILCKHCLHSAFLWAVRCPMARLAANVAVSGESTTLILLRPTRATLALETRRFLAVLWWLLPASALALALALLVPCLRLQAAWLARAAAATACLPVISTHERRVIPLSNELSFVQRGRRAHLHPFSWCISQPPDVTVQCFVLGHRRALQQAAAEGSSVPKHTATLRARR